MMEITSFGQLMLLLIIAVTPRNSSANVSASHGGVVEGAPASSLKPTAIDTMEGNPGIFLTPTTIDTTEGSPSIFLSPTTIDTTEGTSAKSISPIAIGTTVGLTANIQELLIKTLTWTPQFDDKNSNSEKDISIITSDLAVNKMQIIELLKILFRNSSSNVIASHGGVMEEASDNSLRPTAIGTKEGASTNSLNLTAIGKAEQALASLSPTDIGIMEGAPANSLSSTAIGTTEGAPANYLNPKAIGTTERAPANSLSSTDIGKTERAPANSLSTTAIGTTEGAPVNMSGHRSEALKLFTETFTWLQDRIPQDFKETTENLENDIVSLPTDLVLNRLQIVQMLVNSRDQSTFARSALKMAADKLNSNCDSLLKIFNKYDASKTLLKYITKKTDNYLKRINNLLKNPLNKLLKITNGSSDPNELLNDFNVTIFSRAKKIYETKENEKKLLQIIESDIQLLIQPEIADKLNGTEETLEETISRVCLAFQNNCCPLALAVARSIVPTENGFAQVFFKWQILENKLDTQTKLKDNIEEHDNLIIKIKNTQKSYSALLPQIVIIHDYIETESVMITKRQNSLNVPNLDYTAISKEDIESNYKALKEGIIILKNACNSYINHEFS